MNIERELEKELEKDLDSINFEKLRKIEKRILKDKNLKLSIKFCRKSLISDIKRHQRMIIRSKNIHANYEFAKYIYEANIKEHEQIILESKNPLYSYKFALNVVGADIKAHEKVVLEGKTPSINYNFAKNIKGADISAHSLAVINSGDIPYNYFFAKDIKGIDIKGHEQVILESGSTTYNYDFAKYVNGADIKAHGDVILKLDENYFNNTFLETIPGSKEIYKEYIQMKIIEQERSNQTLAIIKPDGMKHIESIIEMFYKNDLKITNFKVVNLDEEILNQHYSHLVNKPYYPKLKEYMMSAPVAIIKLEGENALKKLRDLMGPTDSTKAEKNTIRGMFGTDITYNAIHGSDSKENAEIEIERFFKEKVKTK